MYRKKTVLMCSVSNPTQKPVGIVVLVSDGQKTSVRLSLKEIKKDGYFVVTTDGVGVGKLIASIKDTSFEIPSTLLEKVACLVLDKDFAPLSFGSSRGHVLTQDFLKQAIALCTAPKAPLQKEEKTLNTKDSNTAVTTATVSPTLPLVFEGKYDNFVVATENFYPKTMLGELQSDSAKFSLKEYAQALAEYYDKSKTGSYLKSVSKELEKVFEEYSPYLPLMRKIQDSFFVKITDGKGNFFALGLLREEEEPTYICYALPKTTKEDTSEFLTVTATEQEKTVDFCLILQSVQDGKVSKLKEEN